ncbi:BRCA1-associated protein isoform X2 [Camelus dromedarius]|uniref:BRCA1-associated protein isoform X2 n=1 Tax=Camelus dromedarius TaxID=9838 RepID=UPI0012637720|nr:BRCA1-associated protein isoform X1 [Camelus dromedarius]
MSVSLVVIRLELAEHSSVPAGFDFSAAVGEMSDEEIKKKTLASAVACLEGKSPGEKAAIIHQHLGRREMTDVIIETMKSDPDELKAAVEERKSSEASPTAQRSKDQSKECVNAAPDSPSKQLPDQISFFSGNPSVEIVHGIMHLYKTNKMTSLKEDVRRSAMLCILTVPATMTSHDLMKFVAPFNEVIEQMKIIRDSTPNQYMVLIKFSAQADADSFYMACNGRQFNSIEDDVCQLVYVERAEVLKSEDGASLPVMDLTELPKCTVCLERMDESVNGILTTLCNHSFHSQCLQRWDDTTCPVCRYCQTPEPVEENKCFECGVQENLWICLICGHIGCGRYVSRHAYKHFEETQHTYAMQLTNHRVWDYAGDNYVHRLVASKTDGKIVQYECEGDTCQEEKIDALQLEYSYLLTSQLESQRIYWENKIVRIEKDTAEEVHSAEHESGQTHHGAQRGTGDEQVFASQPSPPAEQAEGGGEDVKGDLRPEGPADHRDPGAAAGRHVLPGDAAEDQPPARRDAAGNPGGTDQHCHGLGLQPPVFGHRWEAVLQEGPQQEGQVTFREADVPETVFPGSAWACWGLS